MKARRKFRQAKSHAVPWVALVIVIALGFVVFRGVSSIYAVYNSWIADLPELNSEAFNFAKESTMYASDGTTLLANFQLEKRDPVDLDQVSDFVVKGTVDVEDVRFGGDFLGDLPVEGLSARLNGLKYDKATLLAALQGAGVQDYFDGLAAEDLAGLL